MASGSLTGNILAGQGWLSGEVGWDDEGVITSVRGDAIERPGADERRVVAGFIDLHVHGGGGADAMGGEKAVRKMARFHAGQGTVALAPTTMTASPEAIATALDGIEAVRVSPGPGEAQVVGAHLEGPFINSRRLGAQPDCVMAYDAALVEDWLARAKLAVATIAPEMPGGHDLLVQLASSGCRVQAGHSDATTEQAAAAARSGLSGYTHLYNAMSPFAHREPGLVGHALAHADHAELICDLEHVGATALGVAVRCIPNVFAITDSTAAAGCGDGEYMLGTVRVAKRGATVKTLAGELAGTAMTMADARRNLLSVGFEEELVQKMVAERPAAFMGLDKLGTISVGKSASLVVLEGGEATRTLLAGVDVAT